MTRQKKSRKPGVGSSGAPKAKLDKKEVALLDKKPKKQTGKTPGNRQKEAQKNQQQDKNAIQRKDPRIGSKKPIALGNSTQKPATKPVTNKSKPVSAVVPIKYAEQSLSIADQIYAIEHDEKLKKIIAKQENDMQLTESDVDYYNDLMEKHEALTAQVEATVDLTPKKRRIIEDEDELWDKFDNAKLDDWSDSDD